MSLMLIIALRNSITSDLTQNILKQNDYKNGSTNESIFDVVVVMIFYVGRLVFVSAAFEVTRNRLKGEEGEGGNKQVQYQT